MCDYQVMVMCDYQVMVMYDYQVIVMCDYQVMVMCDYQVIMQKRKIPNKNPVPQQQHKKRPSVNRPVFSFTLACIYFGGTTVHPAAQYIWSCCAFKS